MKIYGLLVSYIVMILFITAGALIGVFIMEIIQFLTSGETPRIVSTLPMAMR